MASEEWHLSVQAHLLLTYKPTHTYTYMHTHLHTHTHKSLAAVVEPASTQGHHLNSKHDYWGKRLPKDRRAEQAQVYGFLELKVKENKVTSLFWDPTWCQLPPLQLILPNQPPLRDSSSWPASHSSPKISARLCIKYWACPKLVPKSYRRILRSGLS